MADFVFFAKAFGTQTALPQYIELIRLVFVLSCCLEMFRDLHSPNYLLLLSLFWRSPMLAGPLRSRPERRYRGVGSFQRPAEASGCPYEAAASAGQPLRTRGPPSSALFSTCRCSLSLPLPLRWRTTPRSRRSSGLRSRRAPSPRSRSSTRQLASRRAWPTSRCAAPLTHRAPPLGLLRASSNASARPARPPLERSRVLFATA